MSICTLRERLYVPEEEVTADDLEDYTYEFEEREEVKDENNRTIDIRMEKRIIKTVIRVRNPNDKKYYYGFARGNIEKLKERFGHLEWKDQRASPPMTYDLQFRKDRHLKTFEKDGVGQQEVIDEILKTKTGVIKAAPRFGKTVCTVYLALQFRVKTLIITHQEDLLKQFYQEFLDFTNLSQIQDKSKKRRDATGHIVGFFSAFNNPEELDVCLLCWQTLGSKNGPERIAKHRDTWGMVVIDEVHRAASPKYAGTLNQLNPLQRIGLTGTLKRVDSKEKIVLDIVGPVAAQGLVRQVPCVVTTIHTGVKIKWEMVDPLPYLHKRIYNNEQRLKVVLKYIAEDVASHFFICIGFHRCSNQQLQEFTDVLKYLGYRAEAFYGQMKRPREDVLAEFRSGEVQVAVCNEAMLTGLNIPRWNVYYSMFPTSNVAWDVKEDGTKELSGNYKQNFDRVRTVFWYSDKIKKKVALIRDFVDENNFCKRSYKKRLAAYHNQNFQIEDIYETQKEELWK